MMKDNSRRRGSALLIVLGMLSFMIVSAVAFSVYMRTTRAPSSYLRRSVATQHLVKAALCRAIEDIDNHIGNDPYPGVGVNASEIRSFTAIDRWRYSGREDAWVHRVFCPYANEDGDTRVTRTDVNSEDDADSDCIGFSDTAAVLTLEGLGYIPAPLVNQARYWSRRSATARWKRFNYDLGRWAYTAINVSDLFDVNSIRAYTNRNSGAFGRLSLSAAIKNAGADPKTFDDMVHNPGGDNIPLVSVMDYNLAAKAKLSTLPSPFYDLIDGNSSPNGFYGNSPSNKVESLLFVTDSWYPSTNQFAKNYNPDNDNNYYLSRREDQPFIQFTNDKGFLEFFKISSPAGAGDSLMEIFSKQIRAVGVACLYDYLDKDSIPLSLALPCTEQAPMIVGICPIVKGLKFKLTDETDDPANPKRHNLKIQFEDASVSINTALLFPFKRVENPGSFKVQALVRIYLCRATKGSDGKFRGMPLRASANDSKLHPETADWSILPNKLTYNSTASIYTLVSNPKEVSLPEASNLAKGDESEAIVDVPLITFNGNDSNSQDFFTWEDVTPAPTTANPNPAPEEKITGFSFLPYDGANGLQVPWNNGFASFNEEDRIIPNVAVWLRVIDSAGKTVDLAPAILNDDNLNWSLGLTPELAANIGEKVCGNGVPLFNFITRANNASYPILPTAESGLIAWAKSAMVANTSGEGELDDSQYATIYCYDPRYNFAPEDWYATNDKGIDADKWLKRIQDSLLGKDGRDSDIFMFVSNQEYMQSMGELAFLPRTQNLTWGDNIGGGVIEGDFFNVNRYTQGKSITFADRNEFAPNNTANGSFFWRTYRSYEQDELAADPLYDLHDESGNGIFDDDGRGPRVNPYTDNPNIFMAIINDTPYDYWAASTNTSLGTQYANNFASNPSEALTHCFNNNSPLAKVSDAELRGIANVMSRKMRSVTNGDWRRAYNDLDWYGNGDPQCFLNDTEETKDEKNISNTAINDVDRKFLYSFWRSCFGNRQQLFIVFVRAEPSVLGGAQQGGRAVAVVWRDPAPPAGYESRTSRQHEKRINAESNGGDLLPPHRTRVLFYHQFD